MYGIVKKKVQNDLKIQQILIEYEYSLLLDMYIVLWNFINCFNILFLLSVFIIMMTKNIFL